MRLWQLVSAAAVLIGFAVAAERRAAAIEGGIRNLKESFEYRLKPIETQLADLTTWKDAEMKRREQEAGRESGRRDDCIRGRYAHPEQDCIGVLSPAELEALRGR